MKNNTKGNLIISIVLMIAASILSIRKFMNGSTMDGVLWMIVVVAVLIREIRRYIQDK